MSSNMQFWLGLAFAIPLSIVANLVSPKIQEIVSKRFEAAERNRNQQKAEEAERINKLVNQPTKLNTYLLVSLIVATMLSAIIGVFSALLFMLGTFSGNDFATIVAQAVTVISGIFISKICLDAALTAVKVRQEEKRLESK